MSINVFRALRNRNYFLFFLGQGISLIGTWMQNIAMSWLVYRLTNSVFFLGVISFANQLPTFFLSPIAGVFADRWNRRRVIIVTQFLSMLQAFILAVLVLTDRIEIWHVLTLGIFLGMINSFDLPVRQSFIIEMVEKKEDLANAIALNSSLVNGARLIGPTVAGALISLVGEGMCFLSNAASYIAVIIALLAMQIPVREKKIVKKNILFELREGGLYAFHSAPIRAVLMLTALVSLMGMSYTVLMPVFATDILHGGAHTLGFLMGSVGVGALLGAIFLASRAPSVEELGRLIFFAAVIFGTGISIFSFTRDIAVSLIALVVAGFGMMVQMASSNTLLQAIVEESKRGRIMSFYTMAFMGMAPFGSLLAGSLAHQFGTTTAILFGGVCCLAGAAIFAVKAGALFRKRSTG